jgi:hypothetical protein
MSGATSSSSYKENNYSHPDEPKKSTKKGQSAVDDQK